MEYSGLGRRLAAAFVDGAIAFFGFGFAVAALMGRTVATPEGAEFQLEGMSVLVLFGLCLAYFVAFEATLGATPGKLLFGVRVRTAAGERIGWLAAVLRNLLRVADLCFAVVAVVLMLVSPRRQRLGDFAAGTVVVRP